MKRNLHLTTISSTMLVNTGNCPSDPEGLEFPRTEEHIGVLKVSLW